MNTVNPKRLSSLSIKQESVYWVISEHIALTIDEISSKLRSHCKCSMMPLSELERVLYGLVKLELVIKHVNGDAQPAFTRIPVRNLAKDRPVEIERTTIERAAAALFTPRKSRDELLIEALDVIQAMNRDIATVVKLHSKKLEGIIEEVATREK